MEIQRVYVKTRAEFGKQCIFDTYGPILDEEIKPNPDEMKDYVMKSHCHVGVQHSKQLAGHEAQTDAKTVKNSGMFHFEGGWPKEINPRDEETTARIRRRVEKEDNWAPHLRRLLELMERNLLQNGAVNIYQHYFEDITPTEMVEPLGLRTVNVYLDPNTPRRPVNNISWSSDFEGRLAATYCFLEFENEPDYSKAMYIWEVENPSDPHMTFIPPSPCVTTEFNPRDPCVLVSSLMSGQVCSWDIRTGTSPVQVSPSEFSHRDLANGVKWLPSKTNTQFISTSTAGRALWWDIRSLRMPTQVLIFDIENPNEPNMDRAIGVSCVNHGSIVGSKIMFGMENGLVLAGSSRAKSNAKKLESRFDAHYGPVVSIDCNVLDPNIFLSVGDWTTRIWALDTTEGNLVSTRYLRECPSGGCWNKSKHSVFYLITAGGYLMVWDILQQLRRPILKIQLCKESLSVLAPHEDGTLLAIGSSDGKIYLVEPMESLQSFSDRDADRLIEYFKRLKACTVKVGPKMQEAKLLILKPPPDETDVPEKVKQKKGGKGPRKPEPNIKRKSIDMKRKDSKSKDKGKKATVQRDKKKGKEEFLELAGAEQEYYVIIEKEKERYLQQPDSSISQLWLSAVSAKKPVSKKVEKKASKPTEEKKQGKKDRRGKADARDPLSELKAIKALKKITEEDQPSTPVIASSSSMRSTAKEPAKKVMKKKRKKMLPLKLPAPCKPQICRPRICCWRTDSKKLRAKKRARIARMSLQRDREKGEKEDDVKRSKVSMGTEDGRISQEGTSLTKMIDGPVSASKRSVMHGHTFREILEPPTELKEEVARAKQELAQAKRRSKKARKKYIIEKIWDRRTLKKKTREQIPRKVKDDEAESVEGDETEEVAEEIQGVVEESSKAPEVAQDPCSTFEGKNIEEEYATLLSSPVPKTGESESELSKAYLKELEAARYRVYPRVSEYHFVE